MTTREKSVKGKVISLTCVLAGGLWLAGATPSWGGGPPNNDVSDAFGNTAGGTNALVNNTPGASPAGYNNTATSADALRSNLTGFNNTATGIYALRSNTTGSNNTATGAAALRSNTTGFGNTASGFYALSSNTTASSNTASGAWTLFHNTTGFGNSASGAAALFNNTIGNFNTASGPWELVANITGFANTALGPGALVANTGGFDNLAVGYWAGGKLTSGDQNIYLGNEGSANESNTMRLGQAQTATFIAGVNSTPVVGNTVLINSNGQLGTLVSSARFKQDIQLMADHSQKLQQLRPVTFHYKQLPQRPTQYGLIAEEVAQVYPELVTHGAKGEIEGVRYDELAPLLLNEVQRQQRQLRVQVEQLKTQAQQLSAFSQQLADLKVQNEQLRA